MQPAESLPPHGRLIAAGMAGAAAVGLALNHFLIDSQGVARLVLLAIGPLALFVGLGGIVEPRILWSIGKYGRHLPAIYKMIGGALGAAGVACTILLLLFVYRLGPPEPKPSPRVFQPPFSGANAPRSSSVPAAAPAAERRVPRQEPVYLTYDRPAKRWTPMNEEALQGVLREELDGRTTLRYAEGAHPLLKAHWPEALNVGERFVVELQGVDSVELIDLDGADANARISLPTSDSPVVVEIRREPDGIEFLCDGQPQTPFYASGPLRGDDARAALLAAPLRPGFSLKKGGQASFRDARIVKP